MDERRNSESRPRLEQQPLEPTVVIEETDPSENDETLPPDPETLPTLPSGSETSRGPSRSRRFRKHSSRLERSFEFRCPETEKLDDREVSRMWSTRALRMRRTLLREALLDMESSWRDEHYDWTLLRRRRTAPVAEELVEVAADEAEEDEVEDEVSSSTFEFGRSGF